MDLAGSFSILDYNSLREWSKASRKFWANPKNIQKSRDRMNVRKKLRLQLKDPNFLKNLEEQFRNRAITNDNLPDGITDTSLPEAF